MVVAVGEEEEEEEGAEAAAGEEEVLNKLRRSDTRWTGVSQLRMHSAASISSPQIQRACVCGCEGERTTDE